MGVPKFASWISKKYPGMVMKTLPDTHKVDGLYVDMNGIIHPCCHSEDDPSIAALPEAEKIELVCCAVEELVEAVEPQRVLYLGMDGVAPRAKMNQQRCRRYAAAAQKYAASPDVPDAKSSSGGAGGGMAPRETSFTEEEQQAAANHLMDTRENLDLGIYSQPVAEEDFVAQSPTSPNGAVGMFPGLEDLVGSEVPPEDSAPPATSLPPEPDLDGFDSNCISPGTAFMEAVSRKMRDFVASRLANPEKYPLWKDLMVVWSDTQSPGEGEHKIIDFLRTQASHPHWSHSGSHVIVGLDADLILLCLALHLPRVFIMRDTKRNPPKRFRASATDVGGIVEEDGEPMPRTNSNSATTTPSKLEKQFGEPGDVSAAIARAQAIDKANTTAAAPSRKKYEYYSITETATCLCTEIHTLAAALGVRHADGTPAVSRKHLGQKKGGSSAVLQVGTAQVVDDFVALATLMGNDFMPRLPSAFCGESVMDNFIEIYVRHILPRGGLTTQRGDLRLDQMQRFLKEYAAVEAMRFRQHMLHTQQISPEEAAGLPLTEADKTYRKAYYGSTSIGRDPASLTRACRAYVEGLRFVWRYYSTTSQATSWTWFYPFHHAPFAYDLAEFLSSETPAPPKLETEAPIPFVQLLCILPPTSCRLLPSPLRSVMVAPPPHLSDTFCLRWSVDYAAANGKEHLAAPMLPFADLNALTEECHSLLKSGELSEEERYRGANRVKHDLFVGPTHPFHSEKLRDEYLHGPIDVLNAAQGHYAFADTAPLEHKSRPAYSVTTYVKNLPLIPDLSVKLQPQRVAPDHIKTRHNKKSAAEVNEAERDRGMTLSEFVVGLVIGCIVCIVFVGVASNGLWPSTLVGIAEDAASVVFIGGSVIALLTTLGAAVHNPKSGSGIVRNNIRDSYVDWQCPMCGSLNFGRNEACFVCEYPFGPKAIAIYSSKLPQSPPIYDANHRSYIIDVAVGIPRKMIKLVMGGASGVNTEEEQPQQKTSAPVVGDATGEEEAIDMM